MKKLIKIALAFFCLIIASFGFMACNDEENKTISINYVVDGQAYSSVIVSGDSRIELPVPQETQENMIFDGWYLDEGKTIKFTEDYLVDHPIDASIQVYGFWVEYTKVVSVDFFLSADAQTSYSTLEVEEGAKITAPTAPTKAGYIFAGWYQGEKEFDFATAVNDELKLIAKWNPIEYYVEYDGNGETSGTIKKSRFIFDEASELRPNSFEKDYYVFLGWSLDPSATTADFYDSQNVMNLTDVDGETIVLYAIWEKEVGLFTAELDYNGGKDAEGNESSAIEFKVDVIEYPVITNGTQILLGWTTDLTTNVLFDYTKATGNVQLYAIWSNLDYSSATDADLLTVGNFDTTYYASYGIVEDAKAADGFALKVEAYSGYSWKDFYLNIGDNKVAKDTMMTIKVRSNSSALCFFPNAGVGGSIANKTRSYTGDYYYDFNIIGFNDDEVLSYIKIQIGNANGAVFYIDSIVFSTIDTTKDFALSTINEETYANAHVAGVVGMAGDLPEQYTKSYLQSYEGKDNVLQISKEIKNNGYVDMNFVFNANYRKAELERLKELGYKTLKFSYRTDNGNLTGIYNGNHTSNDEISYTAATFERNKWIDVEIDLDVIIENFDNLSLIATKFMYCPKGNYTGNTIVTNFYFTGVTLSK